MKNIPILQLAILLLAALTIPIFSLYYEMKIQKMESSLISWHGNFDHSTWMKEWNIERKSSFGKKNMETVEDKTKKFGKILRVYFPKGSSSPSFSRATGAPIGGAQFLAKPFSPTNHLFFRYFVYLAENFQFVRGGKLPGLSGGTEISGSELPNGENGFSTRFMWRENGLGEIQMYIPNNTKYGTDEGLGSFKLAIGNWNSLEQEIVLNTPKKNDGKIVVWLNGKEVFRDDHVVYRTTDSLKIDSIFFSTFFGGHDSSWATPVATSIDFAGFTVSNKYIGTDL